MYKLIRYIIYVCLGLFSFNNLLAQPDEQALSMVNKERFHAEEDIKNISKLLKSVEGKQKNSIQSINLIKKRIDSRKQVLTTIDKQITILRGQLGNKQEAIEILQADLDNLKKSYATLLNQYYSFKNRTNWLMYIMASESVSQAYKRMQYVREILMILRAQANKITEMTNRLNEEIGSMSRKQNALNSNLSDKNKEVVTLEEEERQSKDVLAELRKEEKNLTKDLEKRRKEFEGLNVEVKIHMKEELNRTIETGISDEMILAAKSFEQTRGVLPWPTMGIIVAQFGQKKHPVHKAIDLPYNHGVDIQASSNADVYSVYKGKVSRVFRAPGMGFCIIIQHGSYSTLYGRLASINVKNGDEIKHRQKIGVLNGKSEAALLHFELWHNSEAQNPEKWILK